MPMREISLTVWAVLISLWLALEVAGRLSHERIPRLGDWLRWLMRSREGRWLVLVGWLFLGWHFFVR